MATSRMITVDAPASGTRAPRRIARPPPSDSDYDPVLDHASGLRVRAAGRLLHGLDVRGATSALADGDPRRVWCGEDGRETIPS